MRLKCLSVELEYKARVATAFDLTAHRMTALIEINISNLADKKYMSTCLGRGDCWWATRRNVVLSATYRF